MTVGMMNSVASTRTDLLDSLNSESMYLEKLGDKFGVELENCGEEKNRLLYFVKLAPLFEAVLVFLTLMVEWI